MNGINGISFGAHLVLQNNSLYKHMDIGTANKFTRYTNQIPGFMTLRKAGDRQLIAVLNNDKEHALILNADEFYRMKGDKKAVALKKTAQYMRATSEFDKRDEFGFTQTSPKMIKRQIQRLDKIAGKEALFAADHSLMKNALEERLKELENIF